MRILLAVLAVFLSASQATATENYCRTKPKLVQCVQPYQAPQPREPHTAWAFTLETEAGIRITYMIDNQFSATTYRNFPQFFGTRMDYFVWQRLVEECEAELKDRCVVIHTQEMHPGPTTNGGWPRPNRYGFE